MNDCPTNVFVYGTLRFPEIHQAMIGPTSLVEATLSGFGREMVKAPNRKWYPSLATCTATMPPVSGVVLLGLTARQVEILDLFERVDAYWYQRQSGEVKLQDGKSMSADIYVPGKALSGAERRLWNPELWKEFDVNHFIRIEVRPFLKEAGLV